MFKRIKEFMDDGLPGERKFPLPLATVAILLVAYLLFR